ncbi:uncharacterized protein LOC132631512 [Lycium barbarum]|uniref:uncharacterized protein LOC132631512 n=1 Tax=Lycium barbarum TaxID=112863 RepID=UPI00293E4B82|nr:uncharacterized protein LOC132631512 [Lycium barbarum]
MVNSNKLDKYKRKLGMQHMFHNCSNKIWLPWTNEIMIDIIQDKDQQVLIKVFLSNVSIFFLTIVYAKCSEELRQELWENLRTTATSISGAWGGYRYSGSDYTWCDNMEPPITIWKRLDRLVFNSAWFDLFNITSKLKVTCKDLSIWSRQVYGDIFEEPKRLENQIRVLEENCTNNNSAENRMELSRCRAEFTRYLKIQDSILRQKARIKLLEKGDANTAYFRSIIKDRRRRITIKKIMDDNDQWLEGNDIIAEAAVSAPGPDGLSACFFQKSWTVIANDLHNAIIAVFEGASLPKFYTYTCLVMIPKVDNPQKFSDLRPISLCNVSRKIISKIINARLATILPRIISKNQSGFVKGRAITENILLTQEISNDIKKPNRGKHIVVKLDMTKAYDRVSWNFLCSALRKMGFSETWGFFKSERGLRQGDPLSLSLFFLSAELLSQMLNGLKRKPGYKGFYMKENGPQINHLSFADDTILFCNGGKRPLKMVLEVLKTYENISGQLINKSKSCFAVAENSSLSNITRLQNITGMKHQKFPIKYLGCPIISGRKNLAHFSDIVTKVILLIRGWHTKLLSIGGRAILIKHVLLALPIHLLSTVTPLKDTLQTIEKYMARFFWSGLDSGGKHHWASWENLCYPFKEGGTNFRRPEDICQAFNTKQRWSLRSTNSLWSDFMKNKYISGNHPVKSQWIRGQALFWKNLCGIKDDMDHNILCKINEILQNGIWEWDKLSTALTDDIKDGIIVEKVNINNNKEDTPIWTLSQNDKFSIGSAWRRYGGQDVATSLKVLKNKFVSGRLGENWSTICQACDTNIYQRTTLLVKWIKLVANCLKLNNDGICVQGIYGGGGTIRDHNGKIIFAYSIPLGPGTSNMAEAAALLYGLKWCSGNGFHSVWGETDSLLLIKCIKKEWKPPWMISNIIEDIQKLVEDHEFVITHCYREANKPADKLASLRHGFDEIQIFNSFSEIPSSVRGSIWIYGI